MRRAEQRREEKDHTEQAGTLKAVLVANSTVTSSRLFHQASKVRDGGSVRGNALQPIMQPAPIHGRCGDDMLKMSARLSNVARPPQPHRPHPLGMNPFDARS